MNSRQRILAALNGEESDRLPMMEIGIWPETRKRWISEGMPVNTSPEDYFGLDKLAVFIINTSPGLPSEAVTDPASWEKYRACLVPNLSRFETFNYDFVWGQLLPFTVKERYEQAKRESLFTVYSPVEPCWFFLGLLMGEEEALYTMALNPEFVEQVISDYTQFNLDMMDIIYTAGYRFDALWVFSDLCYKNGMLFSPDFFRRHVAPYQKKMFGRAKELGMKIIYHCDGYVGGLLPLLIDTGVDCMQPLEARAGNDVRDYLGKYPGKLSFIGNINADALAAGKEAIYAEINAKIPAVKNSRRYIFHSDHSIPPAVSLENYRYALELVRNLS